MAETRRALSPRALAAIGLAVVLAVVASLNAVSWACTANENLGRGPSSCSPAGQPVDLVVMGVGVVALVAGGALMARRSRYALLCLALSVVSFLAVIVLALTR